MVASKSVNQQLSKRLDAMDLLPRHRRFIDSTYETCHKFAFGLTRSLSPDSGLDSPIVVIGVSCYLEIEIDPFLPLDQFVGMLGINQGEGLALISAGQDQTETREIQRLGFRLPTKVPRVVYNPGYLDGTLEPSMTS